MFQVQVNAALTAYAVLCARDLLCVLWQVLSRVDAVLY